MWAFGDRGVRWAILLTLALHCKSFFRRAANMSWGIGSRPFRNHKELITSGCNDDHYIYIYGVRLVNRLLGERKPLIIPMGAH